MTDDAFDGDKIDEAGVESDKTGDESKWKPTALPSCLLRRDSTRTSIKKKVRCSEATEVIPAPDYFINDDNFPEVPHEDDDDVFSDSAPVQTPRGNMCTPYVERKGSLPCLEALPDWFPNSRLLFRKKLVNQINSFFRVMFSFCLSSEKRLVLIISLRNHVSYLFAFLMRKNSFQSIFILRFRGRNLFLFTFFS